LAAREACRGGQVSRSPVGCLIRPLVRYADMCLVSRPDNKPSSLSSSSTTTTSSSPPCQPPVALFSSGPRFAPFLHSCLGQYARCHPGPGVPSLHPRLRGALHLFSPSSRPPTAPPPHREAAAAVMVYITSDLFGPSTAHNWQQDGTSNHWHTMAHDQHAAGLGKRKRQAGDERPQMYERPCAALHTSSSDTSSKSIPRQHRPSLGRDSTRLHFPSTPPFEATNNLSYAFVPSKPHECSLERRPVKQLKRLSPKASLVKSTSHLMDIDFDAPSTGETPSHAVSDLRSCHACNKAPKRKKDLENYMDCRRCEGRTCFICARQCVGCSKAICKKCIVEVGEDGDAWCLDCYSRDINS
jgi:hypothetical protein